MAVIECQKLGKVYAEGPQQVRVLRDVDFSLDRGEQVAILGASGSGKSTLLNLLGGLDQPSEGEVTLLGKPFSRCDNNARGDLRNKHMGFVYQFHHLLPEFSALENVAMPLLIGGSSVSVARARALELLVQVGLEPRAQHKPAELSGGERQRVAIARALACEPACVLMDEPTGNLDRRNGEAIRQLMADLATSLSTGFAVVTHDEHLAVTMDRAMLLDDGQLTPWTQERP